MRDCERHRWMVSKKTWHCFCTSSFFEDEGLRRRRHECGMELVEREIVCLEAAAARPVCLDARALGLLFLLDYASLRSRALYLNSELPQVSPKPSSSLWT